MTDPLDFVTWEAPVDELPEDSRFTPETTVPPNRPTEWNGKPIPDNALWEDDGVTPKLSPTGRIRRSRGGSNATKSRGVGKVGGLSQAERTQLETDLLDPIAKVALGISFMAPTVGAVLVERGEHTARAFVALSANSPRMQRALQRASKVGPAADLAETAVMVFVAIQLDSGAMRPDNPIAHLTGVGALHMAVNPGAQNRPGPTTDSVPTAPFTGGGDSNVFNPEVPPFTVKEEPTDPLDPEHSQYSFRAPTSVTPLRGGPFGGNFPA